MAEKFKFSPDKYFAIPLDDILTSAKRDFPLYIYFQKSDHLILRYTSDHDITEDQIRQYKRAGLASFWCPNEFKEKFDSYHAETAPAPAELPSDAARSDEAAEVIDVLTIEGVNEVEKEEVLKGIGEQMLGVLATLGGGSDDEAKAAMKRCKQFAEDIVAAVVQTHKMGQLWNEIAKIQEADLGHSAAVSTYSVMFALALGFSSREMLGDIAFGATLHDVGFTRVDLRLFSIPENDYTPAQRAHFEKHVREGLSLLESKGIELTPGVSEIILQHHERFDGEGYPDKVKGFDLSDLAQIVAMASHLDDLISGRWDGVTRASFTEAFDAFKAIQGPGISARFYNPELFESLIQAVERGRSAQGGNALIGENAKQGAERKLAKLGTDILKGAAG